MAKKEKTVKEQRQEKRELEQRQREIAEKKAEKARLREERRTAPKSKKTFSTRMIITACIMAGVFVVSGITLAIVFSNPYRRSEYPVAVLHMSDGKKLAFQLYDDVAPVAVAVFHYYAYHGYYNGTVIDTLYNPNPDDATNPRGYMKLGGYTTGKWLQQENSVIRMFESNGSFNMASFRFYMKEDPAAANAPTGELGALSTIRVSASGASAEFQISVADRGVIGDSQPGWRFGMAYEETKQNLLKYKQTLRVSGDGRGYVLESSTVRINKIKFYNADRYKSMVTYDEDFIASFVKSAGR